MPAVIFSGNKTKALKESLQLGENAELISNATDPQSSATDGAVGSVHFNASTGVLSRKLDTGSSTNWRRIERDSPTMLRGVGLSATVGSSALTINLRQADGINSPTSANPAEIGFPDPTATNGGFDVLTVQSSVSAVVDSGATLGQDDGEAEYIFIYLLNNSGSPEIAVSSTGDWDEGTLHSTTALSASADDRYTLYSESARTNVAIRLIGRILSTQTTAGTWAASPTELRVASGLSSLKVPSVKTVANTANTTTTSADTAVDITGASLSLEPGLWQVTGNFPLAIIETGGASRDVLGRIMLTDGSNNELSDQATYTLRDSALAANKEIGCNYCRTVTLTITTTTTIKYRLTCNVASTLAIAAVRDSGVDLGLTGTDQNGGITAIRLSDVPIRF